MAKKTSYFLFIVLIFGLYSLITGCNLLNPSGADNDAASSFSVADANVHLNIVLPPQTDNTPVSTSIRFATTSSPKVRVVLTVIKPGVSNAKPLIFVKNVIPDANGKAETIFTAIPAGVAIVSLQLTSANIQGWTDFHGAADLQSGSNTMDIAPTGSRLAPDILASTMQDAISNNTIISAAGILVVTNLKNSLNTLDLQSDNPYSKAFNLLVTQIAPAGMINLVCDNTAKTLTGMNGSTQVWQHSYSTIWDENTTSALGISSSNLLISRIVRQGFDTHAIVEWRDCSNDYAALTTFTSADGEGQQLFATYGKFDQVLPLSSTGFIIGGYSKVNNCPALYKWDMSKSSFPANSTSNPTNLDWAKYFTDHTYSAAPSTGPVIANVQSDLSGIYTITVRQPDGSIKIYKTNVTTGESTAVVTSVTPVKLPIVCITSPASSATFTSDQSISITTNASDSNGGIALMQFFSGSTQIGTSTSSPWSLSWSGMTASAYNLHVKVTDAKGFSALSSPISITVNALGNNQTPTVALSSPTDSSSFTSGQKISISANATDTDGTIAKVEFYTGTTLLNADTSSPYSFLWTSATAGTHSITAKVSDNIGATNVSSAVSIVVSAPSNNHSELIITEISSSKYPNTTRWFEVLNTTSSNINLSNYSVKSNYIAPSGTSIEKVSTFPISFLSLAPYSYAIVRVSTGDYMNSGAGLALLNPDGSNNISYWGDTGFIQLIKNSDNSTVDFIKWGNMIGYSTSPDTPVGHWSGDAAALLPTLPAELGYALVRDVSVDDSNTSAEWSVKGFATPGAINDVISNTDNDGDGIPDANEVSGKTFAGMPLYDWGARPGQKDIFVHIDYMDPAVAANPLAVTPRKDSLDKIKASFANRGFTIHFDTGDFLGFGVENYNLDARSHKVPYIQATSMNPSDGVKTIYQYKVENMPIYKTPIFHYCLLSHSIYNMNASGLGELGGNDFIIAIGASNYSTTTQEEINNVSNALAGTIMHELGHNLGLKHGGNEDLNYKPNYLSIMNYLYSNLGLPTHNESSFINGTSVPRSGDRYYHEMWVRECYSSGSIWAKYFVGNGISWDKLHNNVYSTSLFLDYSDGSGSNLDETNLNEAAGLNRQGSAGVDWNGDGDVDDTGLSININPKEDSSKTSLTDHNDWSTISIHFNRNSNSAASIRTSLLTEQAAPRNDYLSDEFQEYIVCGHDK